MTWRANVVIAAAARAESAALASVPVWYKRSAQLGRDIDQTHLMDSNDQTDQQCLDAVSKALATCPDPFLDFARGCDVTDDPAGDFVSDTQSFARDHGDKWHEAAASRLYSADNVVLVAGGVIALKFFAHRAANSK